MPFLTSYILDYMDAAIIRKLCKGYLEGSLNQEQLRQFLDYTRANDNHDALKAEMLEALNNEQYPSLSDKSRINIILGKIMEEVNQANAEPPLAMIPTSRKAVIPKRMYWAAAAILFFISTGIYLYFSNDRPVKAVQGSSRPIVQNAIAPGGNKALLTLANGETISLDSAANGRLARQGSANVVKLANGQLAYSASGENDLPVLYNTMSTPRGGRYQLTLPDGSRVWLNAASSITYPTAFRGKERIITITGEAYLEVAKNALMPFIVKVPINRPAGSTSEKDMQIEVLGTRFNVNAYSDELIRKTTLMEGSVKINSGKAVDVLKPGQQAQLAADGLKVIGDADVDEAIAWKNGFFQFRKADLSAVMRQLSRWYDVEVSYEGEIPPQQFGGKIQNDLNLSEVLEGLQLSQVHFRIEGRKLIVMP